MPVTSQRVISRRKEMFVKERMYTLAGVQLPCHTQAPFTVLGTSIATTSSPDIPLYLRAFLPVFYYYYYFPRTKVDRKQSSAEPSDRNACQGNGHGMAAFNNDSGTPGNWSAPICKPCRPRCTRCSSSGYCFSSNNNCCTIQPLPRG